MPPRHLPNPSEDELPDGGPLDLKGLFPIDADTLQKLGLDDLPEPDWEAFGIKLRDPAEPYTPPPGTTTCMTTDGVVFWFHHRMADDLLPIQIDAVTAEDTVGYARMGCFEEGVLDLADVHIEPPYRRRGMGSALLHYIIELARAHGLQHIRGFVVERDLNEIPNLLDWYARLGFIVTPTTAEDRTKRHYENAVALLELQLSA
ncbi:MAG: GNAT family N-acetyltransferase [Chloroflexales bacterium]